MVHTSKRLAAIAVSLACVGLPATAQDSGDLIYGTEGNRLRRYDADSIGTQRLTEEILIERASAGEFGSPNGPGRDINGQICFFPDGSGRFIAGEDTGQPSPRAGWGIFEADGTQSGKLTATYQVAGAEPFGCAFDPDSGVLFTSSVGEQGFGANSGQLIMWFPPLAGFPGPPGAYPELDPTSDNFCKLAVDLGTAGSVAVDPQGRVLVAASSGLQVHRFQPPFPSSPDAAGGCGNLDPQGSPLVDASITQRAAAAPPFRQDGFVTAGNGLLTPAGLVITPQGTLYVSSVLTGIVNEYDLETGAFVRRIVQYPGDLALPTPFGSPQGMALADDGTLYYADLDLRGDVANPAGIGPGPNGKVWRVRFDANGDPLTPDLVRDGLSFPDGVAVRAGDLQRTEWLTFAGGAARTFDNANESIVSAANVAELSVRWRVDTSAVITASPSVALVDLPGEGLTRVAYFQAWDLRTYAVRVADGSVVWGFASEDQPGAAFPSTASIHVAKLANRDRVFFGQGHNFYSLDAATGEEIWRFTAGTGCGYDAGGPPGLCGFDGERNEIESSAYVAGGRVFFGMDVNDVATGKGGFYAIDALDGRLAWFFDLESGATCRPDAGDEILKYDGYHSEAELGLPAGFFASRPGCDHPRTRNGCGNVWSSPAVDESRSALFVASSNCDTPIDPASGNPETMPPFEEAILSLDFDGNLRWVWRPREFDNDDLAFGGVPNLFEIEVLIDATPARVDVVGVGGKDGTYTVLDRDGENRVTGVRHDDDPASHLPADLPYWTTNVVDGGDIGGIIATAAVDEANRRIHFSTAPGTSDDNSPPGAPQLPTVHALDMDTGAVLWDNALDASPNASFSSMSRIPGVVFAGTALGAFLRTYADGDGTRLSTFDLANFGIGSTPIVVDGTLMVGAGIGTRTATGSGISDIVANFPSALTALCVPGTSGCGACNDGEDNDRDGLFDMDDPGCVIEGDHSEVLGDLDYDGDVDDGDRLRFFAAFGHSSGQVGYALASDLDPPGEPDGLIGLVDYQRWLAAEADFNAPPPQQLACGLLGLEPVAALFGLAWWRRRRRAARPRSGAAALGCALGAGLLAFGAGSPASALTTLSIQLAPGTQVVGGVVEIALGDSVRFDILADMDTPIIGFGLDVVRDDALLMLAPPTIGALWQAVFAADGDGLAGLAGLPGIAGAGVLIASVELTGLDVGQGEISLGITPDDPSEGFALQTIGGFDAVDLGGVIPVRVVPEPATAALLAAGALLLAVYSSCRDIGTTRGPASRA